MVIEMLQISIKPGMEAAFEQAAAKGAAVFRRSKGCVGFELTRSHETPTRYVLFLTWETLENHIVDFRASPDRDEWLALVRPFYAEPPKGEHVARVLKAF